MTRLVLVLAALAASAGCSSGGIAPVSGRVTLDGQPLAGAHVSFQPQSAAGDADAGSGSYAITSADGTYTLRQAVGDQPGAVIGQHRVQIVMRNETDDDSDRRGKPPRLAAVIPARYNLNTELTCDVPAGGKTDANFDLKSK